MSCIRRHSDSTFPFRWIVCQITWSFFCFLFFFSKIVLDLNKKNKKCWHPRHFSSDFKDKVHTLMLGRPIRRAPTIMVLSYFGSHIFSAHFWVWRHNGAEASGTSKNWKVVSIGKPIGPIAFSKWSFSRNIGWTTGHPPASPELITK